MTLNGWLQIGFFLLAILAVTPPLGRLHGAGLHARAHLARSGAAAGRAADLSARPAWTRRARCAGPSTRSRCCSSAWSRCWCSMLMQRVQQWLPWNPQGFGAVRAGPRVQHRRVVHDQYELAGLQRRVDHELFHADGRPRVPQLRVGGGRHRGRHRVHPRHRAEGEGHPRQLLGRHGAGLLWVLLPICIVGALCSCRRASSRTCGRTTRVIDPQTVTTTGRGGQAADAGGARADDRAGPGGLAGDHQAVRHQRRRLLQRQQRASRSRTRRRCRTSSRCSASSRFRPGSPTRSAR